jgi:hypothetical protein
VTGSLQWINPPTLILWNSEKPSPMMNFFVTSEPIGDGGNLGGLAGADAHCQVS